MNARDRHYAAMADKEEGRDHDVAIAYKDRLVQSEGAYGRAWLKFNPGQQLVYIDDAEGRPHGITPKQRQVLELAVQILKTERGMTMRAMAERLHVSPSTVSRAMAKFMAWGILIYFVGRGRWAGLVIIKYVKSDHFEHMRRAAKARVRGWFLAAQRRISRLEINVAPYATEQGRSTDSLYWYLTSLPSYKSATLISEPWEIAEDAR